MEYEEVEVNSERWFDLMPLLNEEFRDIEFLLGEYQVSNYGRVKSIKKNIILKNYAVKIDKYKSERKSTHNNYYNKVHFSCAKYNIDKLFYVHRLVGQAFLDNYSNNLQVNHKNGKKNDNRLNNLEMVTSSQNTIHSYKQLIRGKRKRAIQKLDKNKNILEEFECMSDVKRKYGYLVGTICKSCKTNKCSYGYYWKYKEE